MRTVALLAVGAAVGITAAAAAIVGALRFYDRVDRVELGETL